MLLKISNDDFVAREEIYLNGDYQLAVDIGNKPVKIDEHLIEETITVYDYTIIRNDDGVSYKSNLLISIQTCKALNILEVTLFISKIAK